MEKGTALASAIDVTDKKAQYDASCKTLLSFKCILAHILCEVVDEFMDMDWREAQQYIENPIIGESAVDADVADKITGEPNEDVTVTDGERRFDILFKAQVPNKDEKIELYINIEIQKNFNPGYSLLKRGIYYCSRLISRQHGREFKNSEYDKIKKVYSIWICTNSTGEYKNTISSYDITRRVKRGNPPEADKIRRQFDLLSLNMICIGDSDDEEFSGIIELLGTLLSNELSPQERKNVMSDKFDIPMTEEIDEEVERMCNLSYAIEENAFREKDIKNIKRMLNKACSVEEIADLLDLPIDFVKDVASGKITE